LVERATPISRLPLVIRRNSRISMRSHFQRRRMANGPFYDPVS
jgi:hypothetical protein